MQWVALTTAFAQQFDARLDWMSDQRFRGISQSDQHPAWQLSGNVDWAGGLFAGALLSASRMAPRAASLAAQIDAGYTHCLDAARSWDAGLVSYLYRQASDEPNYDYTEAFAGVSGNTWSAHAFFSPDYLGSGAASQYAELNASWPVFDQLTLTAHAGYLHRAAHTSYGGDGSHASPALVRWDARAGAELPWWRLVFGLAVVTATPQRSACHLGYSCDTSVLVLTVSAKL